MAFRPGMAAPEPGYANRLRPRRFGGQELRRALCVRPVAADGEAGMAAYGKVCCMLGPQIVRYPPSTITIDPVT